jgi:hypothetical protein
MVFFWAAQVKENREEDIHWANLFDCMHNTLKDYYEPRMTPGIGICNPHNVADVLADHSTALEIVQRDHETKWPIHTRRVNLFKQEQKEDQSFNQWHIIHLYKLGQDAKEDELTDRDWLLCLLIQSCKLNELRKKILKLPDNKITLENVLALAKKHESTEVACKEKDTINNIFVKKEKKGGKATPSQPVQQPNAKQSSTNVNGKANQTGAKRPCNRCGEESTYEDRQKNCPAKEDTCTKCNKKGHCAVICHNGKPLNANGQVASASAAPESGATSYFAEFKPFKQHQRQQERQQLQQRHQQQQQQQAEECAQINADFGTWGPFDSCNVITQGVSNVNDLCRPTPPLFLNQKPVGKPTFRIQVLADTGAT